MSEAEARLEEAKAKLRGVLEAGDMMLNLPEDLAGFIDKDAVYNSRVAQVFFVVESFIRTDERERIKREMEEEFGHKPRQRILAMMNSKKWDAFWQGNKEAK